MKDSNYTTNNFKKHSNLSFVQPKYALPSFRSREIHANSEIFLLNNNQLITQEDKIIISSNYKIVPHSTNIINQV